MRPAPTGADLVADAGALLEWLRTTDRSWLVVLDDLTDPADLADPTRHGGWWPPHRPGGWTLVTTRLRDAALASSGRRQVDVDVYAPGESVAYLTDRLTDAGRPHLLDARAADLAAAVGHLPLALSHAAAYMINQEEGCTAYLVRYAAGGQRLDALMPAGRGAGPDGYDRPVAVTLLLALDAADLVEPVRLARPALALAAVCDPAGHPEAWWATPAVTGYLSAHRTGGDGQPVTADQARKPLRLLHRYGLPGRQYPLPTSKIVEWRQWMLPDRQRCLSFTAFRWPSPHQGADRRGGARTCGDTRPAVNPWCGRPRR
ncbi:MULTISPECIES: hypothetical protein [Frankia]|uniref:NB-ARC domain-containing protein n=1 Tax=Frankia alni (strain DSM 45986 / CECT 9034 / ACN14a) TaxID=326424 RepID=Q0REP8_FRAAA|nr:MULTISPECIES: hypothetical protein [Frankia]CAJ64059.1 Hypothetical protein FRAAL5426 [Frankia alni ACN14a]